MEPTSPYLVQSGQLKAIMVSGTTNPKQLAGSIMEEIRQALDGSPARVPNLSMHAIGHQAVGQAIKAVPIANQFLASRGLVLLVLPSFEDRQITSEQDPNTKVTRTVMRLKLHVWQLGG